MTLRSRNLVLGLRDQFGARLRAVAGLQGLVVPLRRSSGAR